MFSEAAIAAESCSRRLTFHEGSDIQHHFPTSVKRHHAVTVHSRQSPHLRRHWNPEAQWIRNAHQVADQKEKIGGCHGHMLLLEQETVQHVPDHIKESHAFLGYILCRTIHILSSLKKRAN